MTYSGFGRKHDHIVTLLSKKGDILEKEIIATDKAPAAIGPYSQAVRINEFLYVSGQIAIDSNSGAIIEGDIKQQTRQTLENVKAILEAAGATIENVVKTTVFISDMNEFMLMNQVYAEFFTSFYPARACVEVARLPKDVKVEIEAIAIL